MPKGVGGREDHLCVAPTRLPLPWFRAAQHLHPVAVGGRGGVTEFRYRHRRGGEGGEQWWDRPLAFHGGGGWMVGWQPWDGPLQQPRK